MAAKLDPVQECTEPAQWSDAEGTDKPTAHDLADDASRDALKESPGRRPASEPALPAQERLEVKDLVQEPMETAE